jgi:hypothetical protein
MSDAAIRIHLERLVAMEYVRTVAGKNGQRFEYELLFDGALAQSAPQMMGLIEVESLRATHESSSTTATSQGQAPNLAPRLQGARTELAGTSQGEKSCKKSGEMATDRELDALGSETARSRLAAINGRSHSAVSRAPAVSSLLAADREAVNAAVGA